MIFKKRETSTGYFLFPHLKFIRISGKGGRVFPLTEKMAKTGEIGVQIRKKWEKFRTKSGGFVPLAPADS